MIVDSKPTQTAIVRRLLPSGATPACFESFMMFAYCAKKATILAVSVDAQSLSETSCRMSAIRSSRIGGPLVALPTEASTKSSASEPCVAALDNRAPRQHVESCPTRRFRNHFRRASNRGPSLCAAQTPRHNELRGVGHAWHPGESASIRCSDLFGRQPYAL